MDVRLARRMVDLDIATYIVHRLTVQQQKDLSSEDQQAIKDTICTKGQGLFLYARLMIDEILSAKKIESVQERLQRLPGNLEEMHTELLDEHCVRSGASRSLQVLILQWVTHSARPLRLIELASMIGSLPGRCGLSDLEDVKAVARIACGPLLEILEDETLQVIHHSFTEYLLDGERHKKLSSTMTFPFFECSSNDRSHLYRLPRFWMLRVLASGTSKHVSRSKAPLVVSSR